MDIYIRKIDDQCIAKQISFKKYILKEFLYNLNDHDEIKCIGKKSKAIENVALLLSTDPRFDNNLKKLLNKEGTMQKDDLMVMTHVDKRKYEVSLIKPTDAEYKFYNSLFKDEEIHVMLGLSQTMDLMLSYKTSLISNFDRNRIIFGAPGTGKSYQLDKEKDILLANGGDYERVTFYSDYSYASFFGSYKPVPDTLNDKITYEFVPGPFMRILVKALKNIKSEVNFPYLLLIEEINRSNPASVFGDVFQLLDRDDNNISRYSIQTNEHAREYLANELGGIPDDYKELKLPDNLFIWATMNSADQGVFAMDTAFKRRWEFTYLGVDKNENIIADKYVKLGSSTNLINWNKLRKAINEYLAINKINEDKLLGPFFIDNSILNKCTPDSVDPTKKIVDQSLFNKVFKDKVLMYLFEDAAKQKRPILFPKIPQSNRYSVICDEFDKVGVDIFADDIKNKL